MLQQAFEPIAHKWLREGVKYVKSAELAGSAWYIPVQEALQAHGLTLDGCTNPFQVVDVFRHRWRWRPDAFFQLWDTVDPPAILLANVGEDCDGWAMTHAQACDYALGPLGWKTYIVSYYADPWMVSHHFAVTVDPSGGHWVLQPQPAANQVDDLPIVFGAWSDIASCADAVAATYNAKVVWFDVRTPMWEPSPV